MAKYLQLGALLCLSPLVMCLTQAAGTRVIRRCGYAIPPQLIGLTSVLAGNVPILWLAWKLVLNGLDGHPYDIFSGTVYMLFTYNALGFCYLCTLNVSETSLHIHILVDLYVTGGMSYEELVERYSAEHMIAVRIERMISLGQLLQKDGRFVSANRSLVLAGKVINAWRKILAMPLSPTST